MPETILTALYNINSFNSHITPVRWYCYCTLFMGDETEALVQVNPASSWHSWASNQGTGGPRAVLLRMSLYGLSLAQAVPCMVLERILSEPQLPHL